MNNPENTIRMLKNQLMNSQLDRKQLRENIEELKKQIQQLAKLQKIVEPCRSEGKETGKYVSKSTRNKLRKAWTSALQTPVITPSSNLPDLASLARQSVQSKINNIAFKKGLPKSHNYGIDPQTCQILKFN